LKRAAATAAVAEIENGLVLGLKGRGGALLREKIVASASDRMVVVVDESRLVDRLGQRSALPLEVETFGWQAVFERLADAGASPTLRMCGHQPFRTDGATISRIVASANLGPGPIGTASTSNHWRRRERPVLGTRLARDRRHSDRRQIPGPQVG
jgi:ribose 5-phosphate isomerase